MYYIYKHYSFIYKCMLYIYIYVYIYIGREVGFFAMNQPPVVPSEKPYIYIYIYIYIALQIGAQVVLKNWHKYTARVVHLKVFIWCYNINNIIITLPGVVLCARFLLC